MFAPCPSVRYLGARAARARIELLIPPAPEREMLSLVFIGRARKNAARDDARKRKKHMLRTTAQKEEARAQVRRRNKKQHALHTRVPHALTQVVVLAEAQRGLRRRLAVRRRVVALRALGAADRKALRVPLTRSTGARGCEQAHSEAVARGRLVH